jgi:hypothetical protein
VTHTERAKAGLTKKGHKPQKPRKASVHAASRARAHATHGARTQLMLENSATVARRHAREQLSASQVAAVVHALNAGAPSKTRKRRNFKAAPAQGTRRSARGRK